MEVVSIVCLRQEHLHRHPLLAFNGIVLQRNLALSVCKLKRLLFLLILSSVVYLCESMSFWCSHSCAIAMDTQLLYSHLCLLATHISTPVEKLCVGLRMQGTAHT